MNANVIYLLQVPHHPTLEQRETWLLKNIHKVDILEKLFLSVRVKQT